MKKHLLIAIAYCLLAGNASSQPFRIDSASVAEGEVAVPATDSIYLFVNKKLPFNSLFTQKVFWEPRASARRVYIFLDADRTRPLFVIDHRREGDYSVFAFGIRAEDGSRMERPFTLNYSTAEDIGTISVSGDVEFGDRAPVATQIQSTLRSLVERSVADHLVAPSRFEGGKRLTGVAPRRLRDLGRTFDLQGTQSTSADDLTRTVVFLLNQFEIDDDRWSVASVSALNASNAYTFDFVRPGIYYPVAINYADDDGETIGSYGYHDADGDLSPDPVEVDSLDLSGIELRLYRYKPALAFDFLDLARTAAADFADDIAFVGVSADGVDSDGRALRWTYRYYSPSLALETAVVIDPLTVLPGGLAPVPTAVPTPIAPESVMNSDQAMAIADSGGGADFIDLHGAENVSVILTGGNLYDDFPADPARPIWRATYRTAGAADLIIYMDMATGEVLDPETVGLEPYEPLPPRVSLAQNTPNPVTRRASIPYRISVPTDVRIAVFDILGRRVRTLVAGFHSPGDYATELDATDLAGGLYLYRLETPRDSAARTLVVAR